MKGDDTIRRYHDRDTVSGEVVIRAFCSQCGSTLFMTGEDANYTIVPTGTIDGNINDWGMFLFHFGVHLADTLCPISTPAGTLFGSQEAMDYRNHFKHKVSFEVVKSSLEDDHAKMPLLPYTSNNVFVI